MSINDPSVRESTLKSINTLREQLEIASDDYATTEARLRKHIRIGAIPGRVRYFRGGLSSDFSSIVNGDDLARVYRADEYNTLVVEDTVGFNFDEPWVRRTEDSIKTLLDFAAEHELNVVVAANFATMPSFNIPVATTEEIKERIALYSKYDKGQILGFIPSQVDSFLSQHTIQEQKRWYDAIKSVNTTYFVFGRFGLESATFQTENDITNYFSVACFDHVILESYPFYLTNDAVYGPAILSAVADFNPMFDPIPLDSSVPDSDEVLAMFLMDVDTIASSKFLTRLQADQVVIPCIETFTVDEQNENISPLARHVVQQGMYLLSVAQGLSRDPYLSSILFELWGNEDSIPTGMGSTYGKKWWVAARDINSYSRNLATDRPVSTSSVKMAQIYLNIR